MQSFQKTGIGWEEPKRLNSSLRYVEVFALARGTEQGCAWLKFVVLSARQMMESTGPESAVGGFPLPVLFFMFIVSWMQGSLGRWKCIGIAA